MLPALRRRARRRGEPGPARLRREQRGLRDRRQGPRGDHPRLRQEELPLEASAHRLREARRGARLGRGADLAGPLEPQGHDGRGLRAQGPLDAHRPPGRRRPDPGLEPATQQPHDQDVSLGRQKEMATIYYDKDADPKALRGKTIAVIGYGSQGHAHAQNLRDSGYEVIVGLAAGSKSWEKAERDGFTVRETADAARNADVVALLVPDQHHKEAFEKIAPFLGKGRTLLVAHAFSIHFGEVKPNAETDVVMIAPKAPGHRMREVFKEGKGVPALVAVYQNPSGQAEKTALAYAQAVGPRIIDARVRQEMKNVLRDIKDGTHAKKWIAEYRNGAPNLYAQRAKEQRLPIEQVGRKLREMMPWLPRRDVPQQSAPAKPREPVGAAR